MKNVLLYGGGLDSTALALDLTREGFTFTLLHVNYDQKAAAEEDRATRTWAERLGQEFHVLDASVFNFSGATILHGRELADDPRKNALDLRNPVLVALAASWAVTTAQDDVRIWLGFHQEPDDAPFPDARVGWLESYGAALSVASGRSVRLRAPFAHMTRAQIAAIGHSHDPEFFDLAYTCYEANGPCGQCSHCRQKADILAELEIVA